MIELTVIDRNGNSRIISVEPNISLMEALRDNGVDELLALCGGCCSCATCHVYIEDGIGETGVVGSEDEDDLLESSDHRKSNSRLSCQLQLGTEHTGMIVRIAPED